MVVQKRYKQGNEMNRNITIGQALGAIVSILITVITGWISLSGQVARQEERINTLNSNQAELKADIKEIRNDSKETKNTLVDIKVLLERKADLRDLPAKR